MRDSHGMLRGVRAEQVRGDVHLAQHAQQRAAQVPVLRAEFPGFAAGDEKRIPARNGAAVALLPGRLQAVQNGKIQGGETGSGNAAYPLER